MAQAVLIPKFKDKPATFTVAQWHKKPGQPVQEDEPILEIENDNFTLDILAPKDGVLLCATVYNGEMVKTDDLVAIIGHPQENYQEILQEYSKSGGLERENTVHRPRKGRDVFIATTATVVGRVSIGDNCSIWYGAVIRGDEEEIHIGDRTNIQDGCILHADTNEPTLIGRECIVGHGAIIHGATIGDNTLIGMRATVLNRAKVGSFCLIGAHALVTQDMEIPDYSVVMGCPGKVVKKLSSEHSQMFKQGAITYVDLAKEYLKGTFVEIDKL